MILINLQEVWSRLKPYIVVNDVILKDRVSPVGDKLSVIRLILGLVSERPLTTLCTPI